MDVSRDRKALLARVVDDRPHAARHLASLVALGVDAVSIFPLGERRRETIEEFADIDPGEAP